MWRTFGKNRSRYTSGPPERRRGFGARLLEQFGESLRVADDAHAAAAAAGARLQQQRIADRIGALLGFRALR